MPQKFKILVYRVKNRLLPRASTMMNKVASGGFESRIKNIIVGDKSSLVIVETTDDYPFITNEWKDIIKKE